MIISTAQDETIYKKEMLWPGRPIAFRTMTMFPSIESSLPGYDRRHFHMNFKARGIISSLTPPPMYSGDHPIEASVILDAEVWKDSRSVCEKCFDGNLNSDSVTLTFSCESSRGFRACRPQI